MIDVADSGTGIPVEDRAHIFDAFYTGRAAKGSTLKGTGIGLSVVTRMRGRPRRHDRDHRRHLSGRAFSYHDAHPSRRAAPCPRAQARRNSRRMRLAAGARAATIPRYAARRSAGALAGACLLRGDARELRADSSRITRAATPCPVVDRDATSATLLASHVEVLQRLVQALPPSRRKSSRRRTGISRSRRRPATSCATRSSSPRPGMPALISPEAQRLLRELVAAPETLVSAERAFAYLELQKVDAQLTLTAENRTLQDSAAHADARSAGRCQQTFADRNRGKCQAAQGSRGRARKARCDHQYRTLTERSQTQYGRTSTLESNRQTQSTHSGSGR